MLQDVKGGRASDGAVHASNATIIPAIDARQNPCVEPPVPARHDRCSREVEPGRGDAGGAAASQELTTAAADIRDLLTGVERRQDACEFPARLWVKTENPIRDLVPLTSRREKWLSAVKTTLIAGQHLIGRGAAGRSGIQAHPCCNIATRI
jgi:hypothetical protein